MITSRTLRVLILVALAAAAGMGAGRLVSNFQRPDQVLPPDHDLVVDPSTLDFGEVWESSTFHWQDVVKNNSARTLNVKKVLTSCQCSSVEPSAFVVLPGESAAVNLTINLFHQVAQSDDGLPRPFSLTISFQLESDSRLVAATIVGRIKSRGSLSTYQVHFGEESVFGEAPPSRKIRLISHLPSVKIKTSVSPEIGVATVEVGGDRTFDLKVAPGSHLPLGPFRFMVSIAIVDDAGLEYEGPKVVVAGEVVEPVRPLPTQVHLGSRFLGEVVKSDLNVRVPVGAGWKVDLIEIESSDVNVRLIATSISEIHSYQIQQTISKLGDQTSTIRFVIRHGVDDPRRVGVAISYRGVERTETLKKRE